MAQGTVGTPERNPPRTQEATKGDYVSSEQDKGQGKVFVAMEQQMPKCPGMVGSRWVHGTERHLAAVALGAGERMC